MLVSSIVALSARPVPQGILGSLKSSDVSADTTAVTEALADSLLVPMDTVMSFDPMSKIISLPTIFTGYTYFDEYKPFEPELSGVKWMEWLERAKAAENRTARMLQRYMIDHPDQVHNNIAFMQEPPRKFFAKVNLEDHTIEMIEELAPTPEKIEVEINKRHWLHTFNASLQFSQAYISPNWYQGGTGQLNLIANIFFNVKLNPVYHPNLLFESTMQYKLGVNSAPDDQVRNYSISEDLLQINSTFGVRAAKHWYYSVSGQFKTQVVNSYESNSYRMMSSFLSPADLNLGLGMTYNYTSPKKNVIFDTSISPLSYNMKICIRPNDIIDHENFGIEPNKKCAINIGSSFEAKLAWKITDNISYSTRLFFFTDYSDIEADWENTLALAINKYLLTQIFVHARYDTATPAVENARWHKLQLKEILSFGVAYKFSTL